MAKIKRKLGVRTKKDQSGKSLKVRARMSGTGKGKNNFLFAKIKLKTKPKKNGHGFKTSTKGKARALKNTKPVMKKVLVKEITIDSFEEMLKDRMAMTAKQRQRQDERDLEKFLGPQPTERSLPSTQEHVRPGLTVRTILRSG